ncbi:MAG: glycosyltransferase family 4 protein [archaeon]
MNILIATEFFPANELEITGGIESRAYNLAKGLSKKNNVLVIASKQPGKKEQESIGNIKIVRIGKDYPYTSTGHIFKRICFGLCLLFKIPGIIKKNKIDAADFESFFTYPAALVSKIFLKKTFMTYHEVWINNWEKNTKTKLGLLGEIAEKIILFKSVVFGVKIIAVSEFTKKKLINLSIHEKNIFVVPNGIWLSEFNKPDIKKFREKTVCFAGRLLEHKRVQDLIIAASILKVKCIIIGDGPYKEELILLAKKTGCNVVFKGFLKREELIEIIKQSHILCHPGTVEGFGIILIEAMACKTPYVCSDIDVFIEVTQNGIGGLIFEQKNPDSLAKKLKEILNNDNLYKKKVKESYELAKKYDWNKIIEKIEEIYQK